MNDVKLKAAPRKLTGKKFRLKYPKLIPGVVYGKSQEAIPIAIDEVNFHKMYDTVGTSKVVDLEIEGEKEPIKVLIHEVEPDPVKEVYRSFDLYAVTLGEKLRTEVPLHFEGEPEAVTTNEGTLTTIRDVVEVEANPLDLPEYIEIDISGLKEVGDAIYISDLTVKGDVEITEDENEIVAKISPIVEEEEEEPEAEELLEGEEGESLNEEGEESAEAEEEQS